MSLSTSLADNIPSQDDATYDTTYELRPTIAIPLTKTSVGNNSMWWLTIPFDSTPIFDSYVLIRFHDICDSNRWVRALAVPVTIIKGKYL